MKKVLLIAVMAAFALNIAAQTAGSDFNLANYGVTIAPDKRLVSVLVSLEIAGVETPLSDRGEEMRTEIRNEFKGISPDLRQRMRNFIGQYKKRNAGKSPSEIVAPFITLAYSLGAAPALTPPERSLDLPDDLLEVLDYSTLLTEFYKSPGTAAKIDDIYRRNAQMGDDLGPTAKEMVRDILDYLHTTPELVYVERIKVESDAKKKKSTDTFQTRNVERSFKIVPDVLAPIDTVNFVNIRDGYYAVVSPDTDLSSSEVRRAYLQFVLDPLVLKYAKPISDQSDGIKKLLEQRRKAGVPVSPDVFLAVSRSLVAAADVLERKFRRDQLATSQARRKIELMETDSEKQAVVAELNRVKRILADETALRLAESYENGAVLSFYFAGKFEDLGGSGFDIASSLEDWILSIDAGAESDRLAQNADARRRAESEREKRRTKSYVETTLVSNPLTEALLEIDKEIDAKRLVEAEKSLSALLEKYPTGAARIYYSLGRVASISAEGIAESVEVNKRLIRAKNFFERVLSVATADTDKELIALTYVSLGRIYEFYDQKEYAVKIYETAMEFGGADGEAYKRAFDAKQKLVSKN